LGSIFGGGDSSPPPSPPPPPPLPPAAIPPTLANAGVQAAGANQANKAAGLAGQTLKTSSQGDLSAPPKASQSLGPA
jgi:hypothetical protein